MTNKKEELEFTCIMTQEGIASPNLIVELMRFARRHGKLQEIKCNSGLIPEQEIIEARIENQITQLLKPFGITPIFSGDPRGATVKLKLPSGRTNDWGQQGICVPQ